LDTTIVDWSYSCKDLNSQLVDSVHQSRKEVSVGKLTLIVLMSLAAVAMAANRVVLFEEFTQTG
jgi:hypothetical protein